MQEQHGAHVHGRAQLDLVRDGMALEAGLTAPAGDLLGFEHAPASDDDHRRVAAFRARAEEGVALLGLPAAAGCRQTGVKVQTTLREDEDAAGEEHGDVRVDWSFQCRQPAALEHFELALPRAFPSLHVIQVQLAGPNGQRGLRLKTGAWEVAF